MKRGNDATKARLISEELAFLYYIAIACNADLTFKETPEQLVDTIVNKWQHRKQLEMRRGIWSGGLIIMKLNMLKLKIYKGD